MRRRRIKKNFYLSYEEDKILKAKAFEKGISESELIRGFIIGYIPRGKLPREIYDLIYEIRKIGININQIAYVANKNGNVNYKYLNEYREKLDELIFDIRNNYIQVKEGVDI